MRIDESPIELRKKLRQSENETRDQNVHEIERRQSHHEWMEVLLNPLSTEDQNSRGIAYDAQETCYDEKQAFQEVFGNGSGMGFFFVWDQD